MMWQLHNEEDLLQKAVCDYLTLQYRNVVFYAVPNGYKKSAFEQWKAKVTGLVAGIPDLVIAHVKQPYSALYMELKSKKGTVSPAQKTKIAQLKAAGYMVVVCNSLDEAKAIIDDYLEDCKKLKIQ